ncbi:SDR family oxidoreductase [Nocardioides nematodiphilus]|uniref:SDR family oxidoreductase n=1 Tax=Nocardioides nematodiphilus TaxID=2849669 RepID=UPI001CD9D9C0|nr:SDR family oxidoreductase [Nocardioides nematodiphilus]MCA1984212.1 SDR family oxidoreductase [Nocardioides nematodiphilus]
MRILITGAAGLLGRAAALDLSADHAVTAWTHRRPVELPGVREVQADLTDPASIVTAWRAAPPDLVINAAAVATLEASAQDPALAQRINADAAGEIAALAHASGAKMVQISTDAVFDGTRGGYLETDATGPRSVYAATKLAGEVACLAANPATLVARVNFFGWSATGSRSLAEFFHHALSRGEQVSGFEDVWFTSLYQRDLIELIVQAAGHDLAGVFHAASSDRLTKLAFGRLIAEVFGYDPDLVRPASVTTLGTDVARNHRLDLDSSALAAALGRTLPTFRAGIVRMYEDRASGYRSLVRSHPGGSL